MPDPATDSANGVPSSQARPSRTECGRVGDSRAGHSRKHRRHGVVNARVVTDPAVPLRISPVSPGRGLTPARPTVDRALHERRPSAAPYDRSHSGAPAGSGASLTGRRQSPPPPAPWSNSTERTARSPRTVLRVYASRPSLSPRPPVRARRSGVRPMPSEYPRQVGTDADRAECGPGPAVCRRLCS